MQILDLEQLLRFFMPGIVKNQYQESIDLTRKTIVQSLVQIGNWEHGIVQILQPFIKS